MSESPQLMGSEGSPVFLIGAQRSGTTALSFALNAAFHDVGGLFTVNGKLPYLLQRWITQEDIECAHLRADEILWALRRKLPSGKGAEEWLARTEAVLRKYAQEVAEGSGISPIEMARGIVSESYGAGLRWGEKYNEYLLMLPYLRSLVPEARYVVLIRHPEAVVHSMLKWSGDRPWNPGARKSALDKWNSWNARWLHFARNIPNESYLMVDYEELCRGSETDRMEKFLGLELRQYFTTLNSRTGSPHTDAPLPPDTMKTWRALNALRSTQRAPQSS